MSVQVVSKQSGVFRVAFSAGSSKNPDTIAVLVQKAHDFIYAPENQTPLFQTLSRDDAVIRSFLTDVENAHVRVVGPEKIFGAIFDIIGFNKIPVTLFRHLVVARLAHPTSKLKTVDYLYRSQGIVTNEDAIYRFLDTLNKKHKTTVERVAFDHTKKTLGTITVVFYDMTTLYFEAEDEDDLRKIGFSKDGKFQCPQIMIGLLVGEGGYPIGYDVFEGNTFEGKTLVPTLEKIAKKYELGKPVAVADAAMLSKKNIEELKQNDYTFIVGGRIKNESERLKAEILQKAKNAIDGYSFEVAREDGTRLVVTFSEKRKRKDSHNREKGLKKLRARVATGRLTKAHITNRGYNKFLTLGGEVTATIDDDKVALDMRWDGLKGYVTNTKLPREKIVEQYGHLWQIEKAFRISKTDLRVRPIFHYKRRRIEAHLCISFVAYSVWKELERLLKKNGLALSPTKAGELANTMYALEYTLPHSKQHDLLMLKMDDVQQDLYDAIHKR